MRAWRQTTLAAVALAAGLAAPVTAVAQDTTTCTGLTLTALSRSNSSEAHDLEDYINAEDCQGGETWELRYTISSFDSTTFANAKLTFWTGDDCGSETARNDDANGCEEVSSPTPAQSIDEQDGDDTVDVPATSVVGSECTGRATVTLWAVVMDADGSDQLACGSRDFSYDTELPVAPTIDSAQGGEGSGTLDWTPASGSDDEDHESWIVYCALASDGGTGDGGVDCGAGDALPAGSDYDTLSTYEVKRVTGASSRSTTVTDLEVGATYACSMAAVDQADNVGLSSTPICVVPVPVDAFYDMWHGAGGESGYCFVATAAYGDADHPDVRALQWFRDTVLLPTAPGRWLVALYYERGPGWAAALSEHPAALATVRGGLSVVADGIRAARSPAAPWALGLAGLALAAVVARRRARKSR